MCDLIRGNIRGKSLGYRGEKRLHSAYRTGSTTAQCRVEAVTKRGIGVELSLEALCTEGSVMVVESGYNYRDDQSTGSICLPAM